MKERSIQYYYHYGQEILAYSKEVEFDLLMFLQATGIKGQVYQKNSFNFKNKRVKIINIAPNFKDRNHNNKVEKEKRINAARYVKNNGSKISEDYDIVIAVYNAIDEYACFILDPKEIDGDTRVEWVLLTHLSNIANTIESKNPTINEWFTHKVRTNKNCKTYFVKGYNSSNLCSNLEDVAAHGLGQNKLKVVDQKDASTWLKPEEILNATRNGEKSKNDHIGALGEYIFKEIHELESGERLIWNRQLGRKYELWDLNSEDGEIIYEVKTSIRSKPQFIISDKEKSFYERTEKDYRFVFVEIDNSYYNELSENIQKDSLIEKCQQSMSIGKLKIQVINSKEAKDNLEFSANSWRMEKK